MDFKIDVVEVKGLKYTVHDENKEVARAYLYLLKNDLHQRPFGFLEDVFVQPAARGKGVGSMLVEKIIIEAKQYDCYKLVCTSRYEKPSVHDLYERLGFKNYGKEFRIDL